MSCSRFCECRTFHCFHEVLAEKFISEVCHYVEVRSIKLYVFTDDALYSKKHSGLFKRYESIQENSKMRTEDMLLQFIGEEQIKREEGLNFHLCFHINQIV